MTGPFAAAEISVTADCWIVVDCQSRTLISDRAYPGGWVRQRARQEGASRDERRSLRDVYLFNTAFTFYPQPLYEETMAWDAAQHGTRFEIPFFLFHGASDQHTLASLATEYFDTIQAPVRELALIPGGGHCAVLMQPDAILDLLRTRVIRAAASATPAWDDEARQTPPFQFL